MVQELLRVSRLFQVCFKNVSRDVQDYFNIDARVLEECFISFRRMFQELFKHESRVFQVLKLYSKKLGHDSGRN